MWYEDTFVGLCFAAKDAGLIARIDVLEEAGVHKPSQVRGAAPRGIDPAEWL